MNLAIVGIGHVGLVLGACHAELGCRVVCVDKRRDRIERLRRGEMPFHEPGLAPLIAKHAREGRLAFTTDISAPVREAEIVAIAVGTPQLPGGEANVQFVEQAAREIALAMNERPDGARKASGRKTIVIKSTAPVGTHERIAAIIGELTNRPFDVATVPEFLREGAAVHDTLHPDRVVIGIDRPQAAEKVAALYEGLTDRVIVTDARSAEMTKYAANAFLAAKISFINEIANICERIGVDVTLVAKSMGLDRRIGEAFLAAGIGYGGSCLPKDAQALIRIAADAGCDFKLLRAVVEANQEMRFNVYRKLLEALGGLDGRTVGVWGLAFKPDTDDVRESPSLELVSALVAGGAKVKAYDPVATDRFREQFDHPSIAWCADAVQAAAGCDALCLLTAWDEFRTAPLARIADAMKQPILIDGRNVFSPQDIAPTRFSYYSIGRPPCGTPAALPRRRQTAASFDEE